jgi:hypothetical protein
MNASQTFNATVNSAGNVSNLLTKLTQEQQAGSAAALPTPIMTCSGRAL